MIPTLNQIPVTSARVWIPALGLPWALVELAEGAVLEGAATLRIGTATLSGVITSGGVRAGVASYRVVGGRGGWVRSIPAAGYRDDQGVKAATVLAAAAAAAGEQIGTAPEGRLGPVYARPKARASWALSSICPRGWYVDLAGVTHAGARAVVAYQGDAVRELVDDAEGFARLVGVPEGDLVALQPGARIDGRPPAVDVEWRVDGGSISALVWCGRRSSRRVRAWARMLDALDPHRRFRASWEYRVVGVDGYRYDVEPVRAVQRMPPLQSVPVRGTSGIHATPVVGSTCVVSFLDGDPSRAYISGGEEGGVEGWLPQVIDVGEAPLLAVARYTDPTLAGPFIGAITAGSGLLKSGTAPGGA